MQETLEILKKQKVELIKIIESNGDGCYGHDHNCFQTLEEYEKALGTLVNFTTSIAQIEQGIEMQKRSAENIARLQKEAKENK